MKHSIVRTGCVATLVLSLAAVASAQGGPACSSAGLAAESGFTFTGSVITPAGVAVPFAAVGRMTADADGNVSGALDRSLGGQAAKETFSGTITVNPDCSGAMTVEIYDQAGNPLRTAEWALVVDDDGSEVRGIMTSLVLTDGTRLGPIVTVQARRLFGNRRVAR